MKIVFLFLSTLLLLFSNCSINVLIEKENEKNSIEKSWNERTLLTEEKTQDSSTLEFEFLHEKIPEYSLELSFQEALQKREPLIDPDPLPETSEVCPRGKLKCDGRCVDSQSDKEHCGRCRLACVCYPGSFCLGGVCTTPCLVCNGVCYRNDEENCGICGRRCAKGELCKCSQCVLPP